MATLIDGKTFAASLRETIRKQVEHLKSAHYITPGLAVVLVGENPASQVYVANKGKQTKEAGMASFEYVLPASVSPKELLAKVQELNANPAVHGILVQLPLPKHIDESAVVNAILPEKDVDGFHVINAGRLATGQESLVPCTPQGCLLLLKHYVGNISGKHALVIGRSNIVGKPMAQLLLQESCTVTIAHSRTINLAEECRRADIIVAAVGIPEMVKGEWIKPGATVIDVGINRISGADGKAKLVGDVEFSTASQKAGAITPVPGGVGPMTIACLLKNTLKAACRQEGVALPEGV